MTVGKLKKLLDKYDDNMPVFIPHWQGGYDNLVYVGDVDIVLNVSDATWRGPHDEVKNVTEKVKDSVKGVSLG